MKSQPRIAIALFLIILGLWYLLIELSPQIERFAYGRETWPLQIIGVGALLALLGLATWSPGMMIPAAIVGGIGGLLYWQNATGNWGSWAYAWALIIIFVGIGIALTGLMEKSRGTLVGAGWTVFVGVVQFLIFGAFLGGSVLIQKFWPVAIILLGVILLARGFVRKSN